MSDDGGSDNGGSAPRSARIPPLIMQEDNRSQHAPGVKGEETREREGCWLEEEEERARLNLNHPNVATQIHGCQAKLPAQLHQ